MEVADAGLDQGSGGAAAVGEAAKAIRGMNESGGEATDPATAIEVVPRRENARPFQAQQ